jgi:hypothetical protein
MYTYWKATTGNVFYKEPFHNVFVSNGVVQSKQNNKEQYVSPVNAFYFCEDLISKTLYFLLCNKIKLSNVIINTRYTYICNVFYLYHTVIGCYITNLS